MAVLVEHNTQQIFIKMHSPGRVEPGTPKRQKENQQG